MAWRGAIFGTAGKGGAARGVEGGQLFFLRRSERARQAAGSLNEAAEVRELCQAVRGDGDGRPITETDGRAVQTAPGRPDLILNLKMGGGRQRTGARTDGRRSD